MDGDIIKFRSFILEANKSKAGIYEIALSIRGSPVSFNCYKSNFALIHKQLKYRLRKKKIFLHVPPSTWTYRPKNVQPWPELNSHQRLLYQNDCLALEFTSQDYDLWFECFENEEIINEITHRFRKCYKKCCCCKSLFYSQYQPLVFFVTPFQKHLSFLKNVLQEERK